MFVRLLPPRSAVGLATTSQGSGYFLLQLDQPGNYYRNTVPKVVPDFYPLQGCGSGPFSAGSR